MNKTELVAAIAERTELTKKDADQALKAFIDVVGDELSKGENSVSWIRYFRSNRKSSS